MGGRFGGSEVLGSEVLGSGVQRFWVQRFRVQRFKVQWFRLRLREMPKMPRIEVFYRYYKKKKARYAIFSFSDF
jgi:hypothetical protein